MSIITLEKKLETVFKQELKRNDAEFINASCINKNLYLRVSDSDELIYLDGTVHGFKLVKNKYLAESHCTDFIFTFELEENEYIPVLTRENLTKKYSAINLVTAKSLKNARKLFISIRCSVYNKHHVKVVIDSTHDLSNVELVNFSKHYICNVSPKPTFCDKVKKYIKSLFKR